MIRVIRSIDDMQAWRRRVGSGRVGFVPTMGALHAGHEELLKQARLANEYVVLSLFVNPTQFNNPDDFKNYPVTWDADLQIAEKNQVDLIFAPSKESLYPDNYKYKITETEFSPKLCGQNRPGHFDGVLSVVMKLFQIVRPELAYFGEKDYQQLKLVEGMIAAYFLDIKLVPVPTVREKDGLAMSSRNRRLTAEERAKAPLIYQTIVQAKSPEEATATLNREGFKVDYVEDIDSRRFVAANLGAVRLIDNVKI